MISSIDQVTPKLLTSILKKRLTLPNIEILNLKKETTTSHSSIICFLELEYSSDTPKNAPQKLFLKMSKKGMYPEGFRNEVSFYNVTKDFAENLPILRCYDACFNEKSQMA